LLLLTGRFAEARRVLLAYAAVVRHGLVPNLMDGGSNPRYNARDATWWWLQAVVDYCSLAPSHMGGGDAGTTPSEAAGAAGAATGKRPHLLQEAVTLRFPSDSADDYDPPATGECTVPGVTTTLGAIVTDVVQRHADGIEFREWRAGRAIDAHMKDAGFTVSVRRDPRSGLLLGGNRHNCGTWMDKMGESKAKDTDGIPATPRDGAPVELTGLLFSVLSWGRDMTSRGLLPELQSAGGSGGSGDDDDDAHSVSWGSWADTVKASFEQQYWVPLVDEPARMRADWACEATACAVDPAVANGRGIYKDTVGSESGWGDYQLRPNFLVAMAVAPGLFSPGRAAVALAAAERQLLGCARGQMGVRTLDPSDWAYRGDYTNKESDDRATAAGWNYHQGPEWLWPMGYYLRARMHFAPQPLVERAVLHPASASSASAAPGAKPVQWDSAQRLQWLLSQLAEQRRWLETSPDAGLPELTNSNGSHCAASCRVQAWSSATLLDAFWDAVADA
jgi:glycogen debranching enzyme